jgi:type IV secretion system protein TrbL
MSYRKVLSAIVLLFIFISPPSSMQSAGAVPTAPQGVCDNLLTKTSPFCTGKKIIEGGVDAVTTVADFAKDPFGSTADTLQSGAAGLSKDVLPAMASLTHPDLSGEWFLGAYRVSFALSLFVFVGFIGYNFVQRARQRITGDELIETLFHYIPLFFLGAIFGPEVGMFISNLTGALTNDLMTWGVRASTADTTTALQQTIASGDKAHMVGGSIVAIIVFFFLILALLLVLLIEIIMLVVLYLSGAVLPLSLMWLAHPDKRQKQKGWRIVYIWIGIPSSFVLVFLMLGVAFRLVGGLGGHVVTTGFEDGALQTLVNLLVAIVALFAATLSPLGLAAFAPVGLGAGTPVGPGLPLPVRGGGGMSSDSSSQTSQVSMSSSRPSGDASEDSSDGDDSNGGLSPGQAGGLLRRFQAGRSSGGGSSAAMEAAPFAEGGSPFGVAAGGGGEAAAGLAGGEAAGAGGVAAGAEGAAGGVAAGAGGGAGAGSVLGPIGAVAGFAAGAVVAGAKAGVELSKSAAELAQDQMEQASGHREDQERKEL